MIIWLFHLHSFVSVPPSFFLPQGSGKGGSGLGFSIQWKVLLMAKKTIREFLVDFCVLEGRVDLADKVRHRLELSQCDTNSIVSLVKNLKYQLFVMIRELREYSLLFSESPSDRSLLDEITTHLDCLKVIATWLVMPESNVKKTLAT
jgi:hypothetical protein